MATGTFHTKLAGVTKTNPDGESRQLFIQSLCKPGMLLVLKREPLNPYDSNAVAAWIKFRAFLFFKCEAQIGYLNADIAGEIARYIDKGGSVSATITDITGSAGKKQVRGVNVLIKKG